MNDRRSLLAFFVVACVVMGAMAWWFWPGSFHAIVLFLIGWAVIGVGSAAIEGVVSLANTPTGAAVPTGYRIAGRVFRWITAATACLLVGAILVSLLSGHAS